MRRLFLASEAKHETTFQQLEKFVGGLKNKSIAYIPTAANGERGFESWKTDSSTWQKVQTIDANVKAVQLEDFRNESVIKALQGMDVIWFAGGYPGYLMYWVRRCGLDKALPSLLEKSVYIGSSAGAMVTAKSLETTEWFFGDSEVGAGVIPGLGLVDFDIYPHFEDTQYQYIKEHYTGNSLYLLKNGEHIEVVGDTVFVFGETRILER